MEAFRIELGPRCHLESDGHERAAIFHRLEPGVVGRPFTCSQTMIRSSDAPALASTNGLHRAQSRKIRITRFPATLSFHVKRETRQNRTGSLRSPRSIRTNQASLSRRPDTPRPRQTWACSRPSHRTAWSRERARPSKWRRRQRSDHDLDRRIRTRGLSARRPARSGRSVKHRAATPSTDAT